MKQFRDPVNALTHLIGGILSVFGIIAMFWLIIAENNVTPLTVISVLAFGMGLICLYFTSFTYHASLGSEEKVLHLRKLDHSMVFILIAGSYAVLSALSDGDDANGDDACNLGRGSGRDCS